MSSIPEFTIASLFEAGVHYGHKTSRWDAKMASYIYGERDGIHIIDLQKTAPLLHRAMRFLHKLGKENKKILFVATKKQAMELVEEAAKSCGQYYINNRWLGGLLTNWDTVSKSIKKMKYMEDELKNPDSNLTKKEKLMLSRNLAKIERNLGGIKEMGRVPDAIVVIDVKKEHLAVAEATKLNIPVVAVVDSNCSPDDVNFVIPGNDDAVRSIALYLELFSRSVLSGLEAIIAGSALSSKDIKPAQQQKEKSREKQKEKKGDKPKDRQKDKPKTGANNKENGKANTKPSAKPNATKPKAKSDSTSDAKSSNQADGKEEAKQSENGKDGVA